MTIAGEFEIKEYKSENLSYAFSVPEEWKIIKDAPGKVVALAGEYFLQFGEDTRDTGEDWQRYIMAVIMSLNKTDNLIMLVDGKPSKERRIKIQIVGNMALAEFWYSDGKTEEKDTALELFFVKSEHDSRIATIIYARPKVNFDGLMDEKAVNAVKSVKFFAASTKASFEQGVGRGTRPLDPDLFQDDNWYEYQSRHLSYTFKVDKNFKVKEKPMESGITGEEVIVPGKNFDYSLLIGYEIRKPNENIAVFLLDAAGFMGKQESAIYDTFRFWRYDGEIYTTQGDIYTIQDIYTVQYDSIERLKLYSYKYFYVFAADNKRVASIGYGVKKDILPEDIDDIALKIARSIKFKSEKSYSPADYVKHVIGLIGLIEIGGWVNKVRRNIKSKE